MNRSIMIREWNRSLIATGSVSRTGRRAALAAMELLSPILLMGAMCSLAFAQRDSLWVRMMDGTGCGTIEVQVLAEDAF
jgi:hypothetical protein